MCSNVHRIVSLIEQQHAVFGQHIQAFRGIYHLARALQDAEIALALPASCQDWIARKNSMQYMHDILRSEYEHRLTIAPLVITGRIEGKSEIPTYGLRSILFCGIRQKQAFTSKVSDAELRIDNPLHPEFWMSVPLPELLQHVPEELIRDELERRDRKRAKSTH